MRWCPPGAGRRQALPGTAQRLPHICRVGTPASPKAGRGLRQARLDARPAVARPHLHLARAASTATRRQGVLFGGRTGVPAAPALNRVRPRRIGRTAVPELHDHGAVRAMLLTLPQCARIGRLFRRVIIRCAPGPRQVIIADLPLKKALEFQVLSNISVSYTDRAWPRCGH